MRTPVEIDALLAAPKRILGAPQWNEMGPKAALSAALADEDGALIGGVSLRLNVLTHLPSPSGNAIFLLDRAPVQRLSFRPDHSHVNPARYPIPAELKRLKLPADASRIYRWDDDRLWPRPDKIGVGRSLRPEPATVEDAFALFLKICGIAGRVEPPPHRPKLEF
ncbi:hypothetical protein [uncultured Sphingomonas sp.]|uniref:hypothetical protein n=1 Tax=uncultured Sphingomonas sp. TaxID=158754 RepID=UPI0035C9EE0C